MITTLPILCVLAGVSTGDNFGSAIAVVGDVDGDRVADWAVSDPWGPGVVELRSGQTGVRLWALPGPGEEVGWGHSLAAAGDWNSDRVGDLAIARDSGPIESADILVVSGKDGAKLFERSRRSADSHVEVFDASLDFDRDGSPDLLLGEVTTAHQESSAWIEAWSRKSGQVIWSTSSADGKWSGAKLATGVDFTADGIPDVATLMRHGREMRIVLLSGKDGTRAGTWTHAFSNSAFIDVDLSPRKSGRGLILATSVGSHSESKEVAQIFAFEVGRETPVWRLALPEIVGDVDVSLCARVDANGDGESDVLLGQRMANFFSGRVDLLDGTTRKTAWSAVGSPDSCLGYTICPHPDMDGDGRGDFLVAGTTPYNRENPGVVVALSGASGREIYRVARSDASGRRAR